MPKKRISCLIMCVANTLLAAPAYGSSASLECRTTKAELATFEQRIDAFNYAQSSLFQARKELFETNSIDPKSWGHVFGESTIETTDELGRRKLQWAYPATQLSFRQTEITKGEKRCAWVSGKQIYEIYELTLDANDQIISLEVKID